MTRVLLTGVGGFIASHCVDYWLEHTDWHIVGIDSFRHKGTHSRIKQHYDNPRLTILKHDLTVPIDEALENKILGRTLAEYVRTDRIYEPFIDYVFHLASDSAVERSITDPAQCIRNNYELMLNILELTRRARPKLFIHMSTDEVYGEAHAGEYHKEWSPIVPSNPYSASKAAQEAMAISYWRTYNLPLVLANTMNCIGERQNHEKFLPQLVHRIATGKTVRIYGDSEQQVGTRFYLDCRDLADALLFITKLPVKQYPEVDKPDRYNVVGKVEVSNLALARVVADVMEKHFDYEMVPFEQARPGYDKRYALDGSKLSKLGWSAPTQFIDTVRRIVGWTLKNQEWLC